MLRTLLRRAYTMLLRIHQEGAAWLGYLASFLRGRTHVRSVWRNPERPLGRRVAVFIHFDRAGRVRPYVMHYLRALEAAGFSIVFTTNAGTLREADAAQVRALCAAVIVRRNVGYDFGAMRDAIVTMALPQADTEMLLLANDSVYGPLRPLQETIARVDFTTADVWGATESWQTRYHLQSYFLLVGRRTMDSEAWRRFWAGVRQVNSKFFVVSRYEVGLTQRLLAAGLDSAALWPYPALLAAMPEGKLPGGDADDDPMQNARNIQTMRIRYAHSERTPLNPTAELWRQLLMAGFPFIKRELLRQNPAGVIDLADWPGVARGLGLDIALIDQDLRRVLKHRAP